MHPIKVELYFKVIWIVFWRRRKHVRVWVDLAPQAKILRSLVVFCFCFAAGGKHNVFLVMVFLARRRFFYVLGVVFLAPQAIF